jgi:hypothetical protein
MSGDSKGTDRCISQPKVNLYFTLTWNYPFAKTRKALSLTIPNLIMGILV